jgi:hypothetical protein
VLFWLAFAAQSVAVAPPPGPAWGRAEQVANELRRACMSEAGVKIAMKDWVEGQTAAKAHNPQDVAIERELGEAAYTAPIDVDRLDRAVQERNVNQAQELSQSSHRAIATLRRLSAEDRIIFARRLAIYRSAAPIRTCPVNGG